MNDDIAEEIETLEAIFMDEYHRKSSKSLTIVVLSENPTKISILVKPSDDESSGSYLGLI